LETWIEAECRVSAQNFGTISSLGEPMSMKKKSATELPTTTIVERRIVEWMITKKTIFETIITSTKEQKGKPFWRPTRR